MTSNEKQLAGRTTADILLILSFHCGMLTDAQAGTLYNLPAINRIVKQPCRQLVATLQLNTRSLPSRNMKHTTFVDTNASYSATLGTRSTNRCSLVAAVLDQENCAVARCSSRSAMSHHRCVAVRRAAGSNNSPSPGKSAATGDCNLHAARRCSCISSRLLSAALPHCFCIWTVNNALHDSARVPCGVDPN
jgi:hypothetical protein